MADNVTLSVGSGGATVRTVSDSGGVEWPASVVVYATSTTPGAGTFQFVNATNGLPVAVVGTVPVSGTFWQATQPVSISSSVTVAQATAANLNATVVGTGTFAVQASISAAIPAGTNLIGSVAEAPQIAAAFNGTTAETVQYANFTTSSSGATTIVSAVSGKKIYVLRWSVSANGATNVNLQSHTTTTLATGIRYLTQYGSGGGAYCPLGVMATSASEALDVNNSAAIAISGEITYVQF